MAKQITKSVRLTEDEAHELEKLAAESAATESALMRRWILDGMRTFRIEQAVGAYRRDEVSLREGAAMAGIPIGVFVEELAERHVVILDNAESFTEELENLRATFGRGPGYLLADPTEGRSPPAQQISPANKTSRRS